MQTNKEAPALFRAGALGLVLVSGRIGGEKPFHLRESFQVGSPSREVNGLGENGRPKGKPRQLY